MRMRPVAEHAEPIERGHAERAGEIAVAAAARDPLAGDGIADLLRERGGVIVKLLNLGRLHERRAVEAGRDFQLHVGVYRLQRHQPLAHFLLVFRQRHEAIDMRLRMQRHHVLVRAAGDRADVQRHVAGIVRHVLDCDDLPRHLADRAAAFRVIGAGMRGYARRLQEIAGNAVPRDGQLAAFA